MFETQSLFKAIDCPYLNSSCERIFCPFRHSVQRDPNPAPSTSQAEQSIDSKSTKELPNALENLSNALQTIQDLINIKKDEISSEPENFNSTIVNQLNNLSNVILSTSNDAKKSSLSGSALSAHLKKQQAAAPVYNPTPLNELKKHRQQELSENDKISNKRKDQSDEADTTKKLKKDDKSPAKIQETKKCDLVTFSKLSLSQQVLKRYEMMNKPPPTLAGINQSKLKKKPDGPSDGKKPADSNVPQLILDTASNANMKVPFVIRQKYLKIIFDNCKLIYQPIELACQKAAQNEKSIYDRSKNKQIYVNLTAVLIRQLRTEQGQLQKNCSLNATTSKASANTKPHDKPTYSHEALLNGPKINKISYSINKTKNIQYQDLSATQLYQMFYQYILTDKQLDENSFPKWIESEQATKKSLAFIPNFNSSAKNSTEKQLSKSGGPESAELKLVTKTCKRCTRNFYLNSHDLSYYKGNSECIFHWGKLRNVRVNKSIEQKFSCCSEGANSHGCEEGKHVHDGDYDGHGKGTDLSGFVETQSPKSPLELLNSKSSRNIFALDCEMCYTTRGLELTRVSVVDLNCKTVYESLVKPDTQILDYNTRWSGLTESSLKNCHKNLQQVQSELLRLVNKDTILIGHSLDSDFKALKLVHKTVIDTSVVFPHKLGAPYKRALRNLMFEFLQRTIQEDSDGHDSHEDATSCIHLMIWKINEDLKSNKKQPDFLKQNQASVPSQSGYGSSALKSPGKLSQSEALLLSQVKTKIADGQYVRQSQTAYTQMAAMVSSKTPPSVKINSNS
ncbi:RNA exonuclease 1 -like protein [Brachionus plicatilis]|uniref:RNA exonuclease 1-like protein n=1 Tax=Brachionus plicatilis TaxID=10195 RepID=A0A3M7P1D8_BRAPC|nr:RNA exonuclease 1 -like protein [Brachionus plicatilis]